MSLLGSTTSFRAQDTHFRFTPDSRRIRSTIAPFPHPAHRTGQADFPHPALGRLHALLSRATPSVVSEHSSELIGCPISMSFTTYCVCLELRSLPSTGITRLHWYYEPLERRSRYQPRGLLNVTRGFVQTWTRQTRTAPRSPKKLTVSTAAMHPSLPKRVINVVSSASRALPLPPQFRTYRCVVSRRLIG